MSKELISVEHVAFGIGYTDVQSIDRTHLWSLQEVADLNGYHPSNVTGFVRSHGSEQWRYVPPEQWPFEYCRLDDDVPSFRFMVRDILHGKGGKNFLLIAATIAVAVLAPAAGAALFGTGTLGAALTSAALQAGGYYLIGKLFPAEAAKQKQIRDDQSDSYSDVTSDSNLLARDAFLPIVAGTRRFSPPDITQPRFSIVDGLQTVDRVMAWHGPHLNRDVWIDKVSIDGLSAIETEIHDGRAGETTYSFIDKIAAHVQIGSELTNFASDDAIVEDQETPVNSESKPIRFFTPYDDRIEEVTVRIQLNNFYRTDSSGNIRVPFRLRKRPRGGDDESWFYFPEWHMKGKSTRLELFELRIREGGYATDIEIDSQLDVTMFREVPPVTLYDLSNGNTGDQWVADSHFDGGTGFTEVKNAVTRRGQIRFNCPVGTFDTEGTEWELVRGYASSESSLNESAYTVGGTVVSFFNAWDNGGWKIAASQNNVPAAINVLFASAVSDKHPVQKPGTALVALRSKGHPVKNITVLSSGYVMDWGGSAWDNETTTKNPAAWYYHILKMMFDAFGVDTSLIDSASIVAWRTECIAKGYEVSMVIAGQTFGEVLQSIAAAGFARPVFGSGWGVDFIRDRSSEDPVMTFSPFNTTDISFNVEDLELPQATRIKFQNEEKDWLPDEMVVNNPFATNVALQTSRDVKGQSKPDLIRLRELFDQSQAYYQNRQWVISTFIEHIGCSLGDMVGIVTDIETDDSSGARISEVVNERTVILNQEIPVVDPDELFDADNIFEIDNLFDAGDVSVLWVFHSGGKQVIEIESVVGRSVQLATDLTDTDIAGAHVVIGPLSRYSKRCYVVGIEPGEDNSATIYCVDEAPEIVTHLQENA